ncbi:BMP family ABC transporter substrate-binding protein [Halorhabdus rudnickae]|uniref:BMP family ABC transporter substrate-binding protein n=1 Tax=Halorhabdus rudnickae TaxID=1775544 RepID=UPI001FCE68D9|nr:BMP family ABC transporter substrate-binding protein [Halorhabdus rudnickae]
MAQKSDNMGPRTHTVTDSSTVLDRRSVLKGGAAMASALTLAGCSGGDTTTEPGGGDGGGGGETTNIAIVSSSAGFGDQAFNTLAVQGLETAAEEYDISLNQVEETSPSNYQSVQSNLASSTNPSYDVIVLVGYQHKPALQTNAEEYPGQQWMIINDHVEQPNVAGYVWANHEMSFLAGVMAGTMTTRDFSYEGNSTDPDSAQVGFVGGVDGPLINAFERAYKAGVGWVNEETDVSVGYIGNYQDTQKATNIASSQYDSGADIVYQAAAAAGQGVFPAAQSASRFAIGVDADQSKTLPEYQDVIMGSAVKFINEGTREVAQAVVEDDFDSVSGRNVLGVAEDGVALVKGQAIGSELPDVVDQNLEEARQAIANGDINVPCTAAGCQD